MNKTHLGNLFLILGVCSGTVGAAGFSQPPEPQSYGLFGVGLVLVVIGGLILRRELRGTSGQAGHSVAAVGDLQHRLESIGRAVIALDEQRTTLSREEFCERLNDLLEGEYFELGDRHEEYQQLLGYARYTKVWSGVAVCERLLARAWSIATDGFLEEACTELPPARAAFEGSLRAAEAL